MLLSQLHFYKNSQLVPHPPSTPPPKHIHHLTYLDSNTAISN